MLINEFYQFEMFGGISLGAVAMVNSMLSSDELSTHALELYSPHDVYERAQRRREYEALSAAYRRPLPMIVGWTSGMLTVICMVLSFAALSVGGLFAAIVMFSAACLIGGAGLVLVGDDSKSWLLRKHYHKALAAAPTDVALQITISSTIEYPSSRHPRLVTALKYNYCTEVLESIDLDPASDDIPALAARCRIRNQASLAQLTTTLSEDSSDVHYTLTDAHRQQLLLAQSMLDGDSADIQLPPEQRLIETADTSTLSTGE